jgi:mediator of replication checkpoint protein 1
VDTVIVPAVQVLESPIAKKKGRLLKRKDALAAFSDLEDSDADPASGDSENKISANAFDVMKKAVKEKTEVDNFDKKKSRAKDMVEEQAEESEDEYAGLGGASDDGSGDEEDEEMKKMIDEGEVDVNERKIAAFYA